MKRKLQIFISSTFLDLREDRQAAVSAILKAGHIPAGMELFTSGDQSQMDVIKRWIDESDAYMLILGARYGSIEPRTKLSYTELEFDYAVAMGKPIFSVIISDLAREERVKGRGSEVLETMNSNKLQAFDAKVRSQICAFFDDEKDIRLAVYEKMLEFSSRQDLSGWVKADGVEDTAPLRREIDQLRRENLRLSSMLDERSIADSIADHHSRMSASEFDRVSRILKNKIVSYDLENDGKRDISVYETLLRTRNILTKGSNIADSSTGITATLEAYAFPLMVVHGLVSQSPTANGTRYQMSEKGLIFLAMVDAASVQSGVESGATSSEISDNSGQPVS